MTAQDDLFALKEELTAVLVDLLANNRVDSRNRENLPALGDLVILGRNPLVIAWQFMRRFTFFPYSHAAISLGPRLYVDAMPNHGVRVKRWKELKQGAHYKAFRHRGNFISDPQKIAQIIRNYGRPYSVAGKAKNYPLIRSHAKLDLLYSRSIFCSEFVGEIYSRDDVGIKNGKRSILPCDLKNITKMAEWTDVTYAYENYTEDEFECPLQDARELALSAALEAVSPVNSIHYGIGKINQQLARVRSETDSVRWR